MSGPGRFLERWSRLKRAGVPTFDSAPVAASVAVGGDPAASPAAGPAPVADGSLPPRPPGADGSRSPDASRRPLPPVESLTFDADFTGFLAREVGESLRRAAMRKLFSDPHFNRMDGLDVYIDDYSTPDPIPPDTLKRLRQYERLVAPEANEELAGADRASAITSGSPRDPQPDEPGPPEPMPQEPEPLTPEPDEPERDDPAPGEPGRRDPEPGEPDRDEPRREPPGRDVPELPERDSERPPSTAASPAGARR